MLYIACTRAMHKLHLTDGGSVSRFLDFADEHRNGLGVVDAETTEIRDRATDARVG